jgi:hypothetical protein
MEPGASKLWCSLTARSAFAQRLTEHVDKCLRHRTTERPEKKTTSQTHITSDDVLKDSKNFSLVWGGPLYQLLQHAHLSDDVLTMVRRRVVVIALLAWLPLLILSALGYALTSWRDPNYGALQLIGQYSYVVWNP